MLVLKRKKSIIVLVGLVALLVLYSYEASLVLSDSQMSNIDTISQSDCGIVLTGAPGRIRESFEILAQNKVKRLIVSGVYKEAQLREIFPQLPFYPEINVKDVILEKHSESTYGNAIQSLALVKSLQCHNVLLITSQLHMYRAYHFFRVLFPNSIEIKKFTVANTAKDSSFFDILLETTKSIFYSALSRVI